MANTYVAIATVTVGSGGASSIDFSSIPQTYTDLVLKMSLRSGGVFNVLLSLNSSSANFTMRNIEGDGSTVASYTGTTRIGVTQTVTANTFNSMELYFPNYAGSTNKSISVDMVTEANQTGAYADLAALLWSQTAAINAIGITVSGSSFTQYSTATLYGIKNS